MCVELHHRLCAAWDVEGHGKRDPHEMVEVMANSCAVALGRSAGSAVHQRHGDGGLIEFPPALDEPEVLRTLLREFVHRLQQVNRPLRAEYRIRVRLALHAGLVRDGADGFTAQAVIVAGELCNAIPIKKLLASGSGDHVVVLSDPVFQDAVRAGLGRELLATFRGLTVPLKRAAVDAWVMPG